MSEDTWRKQGQKRRGKEESKAGSKTTREKLLVFFISDRLFALVYVKFENITFGWIRLKEQTASFETCYLDCYYEGEKCQGFTFSSNDKCLLIRQLFANFTEGQAVLVGQGRVYVKDSKALFSQTDVCIPNKVFSRLVKAMAVCEDDWVYLVETNSCYLPVYAGRNEFSFEQAVSGCVLYDAHPASVHSAFEMSFINEGYWFDNACADVVGANSDYLCKKIAPELRGG
ncbi:hypothetical protein Tcan_11085 [Toxocara canis]|uniref:Uncharacterized protein n=1 Tax=Toxocara canis TaxID=6265 RepID=A0A0B2VVK3_TOXCA|nr:hypothetical protein Tcan_11085 [Toxocara canis]